MLFRLSRNCNVRGLNPGQHSLTLQGPVPLQARVCGCAASVSVPWTPLTQRDALWQPVTDDSFGFARRRNTNLTNGKEMGGGDV